MNYYYYYFFRKQGLTFHANYILWRQFHEMSNPVFWNKPEKNISKCLLIAFFDWATGMCNYYFCKHLMKYCRGESYYHTSFSKITTLYLNSKSAANQMIGTRTLHVAHLYWGVDSPDSRILSLCIFILFIFEW